MTADQFSFFINSISVFRRIFTGIMDTAPEKFRIQHIRFKIFRTHDYKDIAQQIIFIVPDNAAFQVV